MRRALWLTLACALVSRVPAATCDVVRDCGARADNATDAARALSACVAAGGPCGEPNSTLIFPENAHFYSGSIDLSDTVNLTLSFLRDAGLFSSADAALFPLQVALPPTNMPQFAQQWRAFIYARNVSGLTFEGPSSAVVDGNGWPWWRAFNNGSLAHQRPKLVEIVDGERVTFKGLTFRNSPFWTLHTLYCRDVQFLGVTVTAPRSVGNTDGIDPDSCSDVLIQDCVIDVGDDGISLKSDYRVDPVTGRVTLLPTERVVIRNTTVLWRNIAIGSSTYGNITDVLVDGGRVGADVDALPTPWAIKVKTHTPFGGVVRNVTFRGTQLGTIDGTALDVFLTPYNAPVLPPGPAPAASSFSDISFLDVRVLRARAAGSFRAEAPFRIDRLTLRNVTVENAPSNSSRSWACARLAGTVAEDVSPPLPAACF